MTGLELLKTAIAKAGYSDKIKIGMDVAASGMIQHPLNIDFTFTLLWRRHPLDQHCIQEVTIVHFWELKAAVLVIHLGLNKMLPFTSPVVRSRVGKMVPRRKLIIKISVTCDES